jgi:hypothetical protein
VILFELLSTEQHPAYQQVMDSVEKLERRFDVVKKRRIGELPPVKYNISNGPIPKSFWSYQVSEETPSLREAIALGAIASSTTEQQWNQLSPGMKREITRQAKRRAENK